SCRPSVLTSTPTNIFFPHGTVAVHLRPGSSQVHKICGSNSERQDTIITLTSTLAYTDNLLQLAEVYQRREEYAQAVDFVDRALFTYKRAFIGAFTFTAGTSRMDFDRVENRPFFLAVHQQIA
ncbi:hypothetical protein C0991_002624, partial [Blastosporella zonata]